MGIALSFLAVKGLAPEAIHRTLGLSDTGIVAGEWDYPRPDVRGATLPDGWYLILLKDADHRFVMEEEIPAQLSQGGEVVACRLSESVMASACLGWKDGAKLWEVEHESDEEDPNHLAVEGTPPAAFEEIASRMRAKQAEEDSGDPEMAVDYIWEIPIELANSLCRYRHDAYADWGKPEFTILTQGEACRG
jgi:hypothetical protein